jgi:ATP-dependent Clp protease ATP-binding subunit ClpC
MKEKLLGEVKKIFRPEFLNRIDGMVVFHALNKQHIRSIVDLNLKTVSQQLTEKGVKLEVTEAAKDLLGEKGYDEMFGARPLKRAIQDLVIDKLSEAILRSEFRAGDTAVVDVEDGQIVLRQPQVPVMAGNNN